MNTPNPTPDRPPLWRVMHDAHAAEAGTIQYSNAKEPVLGEPDRFTRAAEIRAVRDYIRHHVPGNGWHTWQIRQLMDLLNDEADRAERGDG